MSISLSCKHCGKAYRVKDELAGKRVKCAKCGGAMAIPAAEGASRGQSSRTKESPRKTEAAQDRRDSKESASPAKPRAEEAVKSGNADAAAGLEPTTYTQPTLKPKASDAYDVDPNASSKPSGDKNVVMAGHVVKPTNLDDDDELEVEPPVETLKADLPILDDETDGGKTASAKGRNHRPHKGTSTPRAAVSADDLVVAEEPKEKPKPEPTKTCPGCRGNIPQSAVLCVNCGLDLRTGEKLPGAPDKPKRGLGRFFGG